MTKYCSEVCTVALEIYEAKSHEQRMIVKLFGDVVVPCKTTAEFTHPHTNNNQHDQRQHLACTTRNNNNGLLSQVIDVIILIALIHITLSIGEGV